MRHSLLTIVFSVSIMVPPAIAETLDAVWKTQEVEFTFFGLDMAYSCDSIEGRIELLLRHVGAEDVEVTVPSCGGFKIPQRRHRIFARYSTLVRAVEGDADIVQAAWSEVELGKRRPRAIDDHDCELLEQFQKHILATIEHEVIEGTTGCGATRRSIVGRLKMKVLKPAAEGNAAKNEA